MSFSDASLVKPYKELASDVGKISLIIFFLFIGFLKFLFLNKFFKLLIEQTLLEERNTK